MAERSDLKKAVSHGPSVGGFYERVLEAHTHVERLAEFVGYHQPLVEPQLVMLNAPTSWVVLPASLDPHVTSGRLSVPAPERRRLRKIEASGVKFDSIVVAHEVPTTKAKAVSAGSLRDPAKCAELIGEPTRNLRVTKFAGITVSTIRGAAVGLAAVAAGGAVAGAAITAAPLALASMFALDPALFGVVVSPDPRQPAAWWLLASWSEAHV